MGNLIDPNSQNRRKFSEIEHQEIVNKHHKKFPKVFEHLNRTNMKMTRSMVTLLSILLGTAMGSDSSDVESQFLSEAKKSSLQSLDLYTFCKDIFEYKNKVKEFERSVKQIQSFNKQAQKGYNECLPKWKNLEADLKKEKHINKPSYKIKMKQYIKCNASLSKFRAQIAKHYGDLVKYNKMGKQLNNTRMSLEDQGLRFVKNKKLVKQFIASDEA